MQTELKHTKYGYKTILCRVHSHRYLSNLPRFTFLSHYLPQLLQQTSNSPENILKINSGKLGVVEHGFNTGTHLGGRGQSISVIEASLVYTVRPCLKIKGLSNATKKNTYYMTEMYTA